MNAKIHSSHFEIVHIQVQKIKIALLNSTCLLKEISKIQNIEKKVASVNEKKNIAYKRKWGEIDNKLP